MSISIHAPRTGSDATYKCPDCGATVISIHAPRTGSDVHRNAGGNRRKHFNPRSPHGERPVRWAMTAEICHFNPRSPHGERHADTIDEWGIVCDFNPRSPHGERRRCISA